MNQHVLEILRESMVRRWVQHGKVEQIRTATIRGKKEELIVINFQNTNLYCKKEDFLDREVNTFNGFLHTRVPFIVTNIMEAEGVVLVSRREAIPRIVDQFLEVTRQGDKVRGVVTGVLDSNLVFVDVSGFPCIIPASEWDVRKIRNLRDQLPVGTEIEAIVQEIRKDDQSASIEQSEAADVQEEEQELVKSKVSSSQEYGYRVILSRRALVVEGKGRFWDEIKNHHNIGDKVSVKITGRAPGANSYFCELPSGITFIGNLSKFLKQKFHDGLPAGVVATAEITQIEKSVKRGRVLIFRLEANHAAMMNNAYRFI